MVTRIPLSVDRHYFERLSYLISHCLRDFFMSVVLVILAYQELAFFLLSTLFPRAFNSVTIPLVIPAIVSSLLQIKVE